MFDFLLQAVLLSTLSLSSAQRNDAPIVGVLAQTLHLPQPNRTSYIAASYVKFLESAGARVVPIKVNQTLEEYKRLFYSINGVIFPGGRVSIVSSSYARTARIFYELAINANSRGDYFPVWGTCLGYEQLIYLTSGKLIFSRTNTTGVALPLTFTNESSQSRMLKDFPADVLEALGSQPLTEHSHMWSLAMESYNSNEELRTFYKVLSTNTDGKIEFASTIEAYDFPFYGTQWHPEKNSFEWRRPYIPHTRPAIKTTFYMADFLVNEARKSLHRFGSKEEEKEALIYNFTPTMTTKTSPFELAYFF